MKKLALNVESLKVQAFETAEEPRLRGTVQAHESDYMNDCTRYCNTEGECTYWRSCWTERYDCVATEAGYTCGTLGC